HLFFFSSRRRHTRFSRDWSSDVCSSDLSNPKLFQVPIAIEIANQTKLIESISFTKTSSDSGFLNIFGVSAEYVPDCPKPVELDRSEERRVGKECSCMRSGVNDSV